MSYISNTEQTEIRRSQEAREVKENKEGADEQELEIAAALERADLIFKEVKQSKQQIQNIILHLQTVVAAIRQLRRQLQLAEGNDDPASVARDKKRIAELKKKINAYGDELKKMRGDLIREQQEELRNGIGIGLSSAELEEKAVEMVEKMIVEVKKY